MEFAGTHSSCMYVAPRAGTVFRRQGTAQQTGRWVTDRARVRAGTNPRRISFRLTCAGNLARLRPRASRKKVRDVCTLHSQHVVGSATPRIALIIYSREAERAVRRGLQWPPSRVWKVASDHGHSEMYMYLRGETLAVIAAVVCPCTCGHTMSQPSAMPSASRARDALQTEKVFL